jgi:hypothetical protein
VGPARLSRMTTSSTADIRKWARAAGLVVGDRGRLSPDIVAAYNDAHAVAPAAAAAVATASQEQPRIDAPPRRTVRAKQHWDWARREAKARTAT